MYFTIFFAHVQNFTKWKLKNTFIFLNFDHFHKPSMGSREVLHKIWARSVQPFWRLLDTNKQTDTQSKFKYRWMGKSFLCMVTVKKDLKYVLQLILLWIKCISCKKWQNKERFTLYNIWFKNILKYINLNSFDKFVQSKRNK